MSASIFVQARFVACPHRQLRSARKHATEADLHDLSRAQTDIGITLAISNKHSSLTATLGGNALLHGKADDLIPKPYTEARHMRKLIIALMISAAFIVSGISATTFSDGQLSRSVWAEGGGD